MNKINYPENLHGRDFVCGDLHGSFQRLTAALEFIKFDKNIDRLFSVGDLVDRGPENEKCLRLLLEPWFFAVRGNHEQLMTDFFADGPYAVYWAQNGGLWSMPYWHEKNNEIQLLAQKAAELPVMITVTRQDGKHFHVIHAELGVNKPLTDNDLENKELFEQTAFMDCENGDAILWSRWLFGGLYDVDINKEVLKDAKQSLEAVRMFTPELSHIYCGHTPMLRPTRIKGQTNLDTKAFKSFMPKDPDDKTMPNVLAGLTITEPLTDRFWLASYYEVKEVNMVVYE